MREGENAPQGEGGREHCASSADGNKEGGDSHMQLLKTQNNHDDVRILAMEREF